MSSYPFFIPEFVLCANSSLFSFKIANEPSEFRNYLSYVNDKGGELSTILHEEWEDFMYGVTPTAEEALKKATERGNALLAE